MSEPEPPVRIVLTPEQREVVKRLSGQHVEAIELASDQPETTSPPTGGPLRFLWRLSQATGIPRQAWITETDKEGESKP